jgi:hypothetical protein
MSALAFVLDTSAVNANTIARIQNGGTKPDTRSFRFHLVHDLVAHQIRRRMYAAGIQTRIRNKARDYLGKLTSNCSKFLRYFLKSWLIFGTVRYGTNLL